MNLLASFLGRLLAGLWRGLLAVLGMAVVLGLLLMGLALSLVLIVWALLRGRRPAPVQFRWRRAGQGKAGPMSEPQRRDPVDVVDVEAREIPRPSLPDDGGSRP